jgi:hypothetical protein
MNENLGRLRVSRIDGDTDGDGDLDEIFGFGTRSLAVWSTSGQLTFESGDQFEQITALAVPNQFNASEDSNAIDSRSDDRGPESEEAAVGTVHGRNYAFIGLERISGIMVYDVTDPVQAEFQQYINNRNFSVEPGAVCGPRGAAAPASCSMAGDLETEGVTFVPAEQSPNGLPLLLVSHEASDSVTIYQIASLPVLPGDYNNDGEVDSADYVVWRNNVNSSSNLPNDLTAGVVDVSDYDVWRAHFGTSLLASSSTRERDDTNRAVPEPLSSWLVVYVAGLLFVGLRPASKLKAW